MKIEVTRQNNKVHFQAKNEQGNIVNMDGSPGIGGEGLGARPMELLLMGLGGCSGIDIVSILEKMKQPLEDFNIVIDGHRQPNTEPSLFENIHVHFILKGKLDKDKVERAISLSMEKYCSVAKTLEKTAKITWDFELV